MTTPERIEMRTPAGEIAKNIVKLYEHNLQFPEEGESRFTWLERQIEKAVELERQHQAKLEAKLEESRDILNKIHNCDSYDSRLKAVRLYEFTDELHDEVNGWLSR